MNQKGFATIFGLCLLLVFALIIKGISAAEMNHAYEATDYLAEAELQNAAISGIYQAAQQVNSGAVTLPINKNIYLLDSRLKNQHKFENIIKSSKEIGKITVETWGEHLKIQNYAVDYSEDTSYKAKATGSLKEAYIFFSRASANAKRGKIYRRAHAYILVNDPNNTIHFLELPMSTYKFK